MDSKGSSAEISYPNIFFILDNFEEVNDNLGYLISGSTIKNASYLNNTENFVVFVTDIPRLCTTRKWDGLCGIGC